MANERVNPLNISGGGVLDVAHGGTGADSAEGARESLGITPNGIGAAGYGKTKDADACRLPLFVLQNLEGDAVGYPTAIGGNQCLILNLYLSGDYGAQLALTFDNRHRIAIRNKFNSYAWGDWEVVVGA